MPLKNYKRARKVKPFRVQKDTILDCEVKLEYTELYTVLTIGARQYYFHPKTGELDGTGTNVG